MNVTLDGTFHVWRLVGQERRYADVHLPYREAIELVIPVTYNAVTGKGEQRDVQKSHVRKLRGEIEDGNYTPTQMTASVRRAQLKGLRLNKDQTYLLEVDSQDPLAQTDGSHRFAAMQDIVKNLRAVLAGKITAENKKMMQKRLDAMLELQIGIRIFFDGDPQRDFINLQSGRPADRSHMVSLRVRKGMTDEVYKKAYDIAQMLDQANNSPFKDAIRFDSKDNRQSPVHRIPVSTFLAKAGSDLGTSLIGLVRAVPEGTPPFLTFSVVRGYESIAERNPALLEHSKPLTAVGNGGTKGSATMILGLGVCLAYRLSKAGRSVANDDDSTRLTAAAGRHLGGTMEGGFAGPMKRTMIGAFARDFLGDMDEEFHDGIPLPLLKLLAPSAYDAASLPKAGKKAARRPDNEVEPWEAGGQPWDAGQPEEAESMA